jgi:hypothetical protein
MGTQKKTTPKSIRGASAPRVGLHPWLRLMTGIVAVLAFIFGIGTLATYLPGAKHMSEVIEERELRATAIFYTDFKESAEGSEYIRDCIEYPPVKMPRP